MATLGVRPIGLRGYAFRFGNPTSSDARVTAAVACRKIPGLTAKSPFLRLTLVKSKPVTVPPGGQKTVSLACPAGTLAGAAPGFDLDSGRLSVRRQTQTLRAFSMTVRNLGTTSGSTGLYGGCLTLIRPPGRCEAAAPGVGADLDDADSPGRAGADAALPEGLVLALDRLLAAGRAQSWRLGRDSRAAAGGRSTSAAAAQTLADLQLVCGRLAPS